MGGIKQKQKQEPQVITKDGRDSENRKVESFDQKNNSNNNKIVKVIEQPEKFVGRPELPLSSMEEEEEDFLMDDDDESLEDYEFEEEDRFWGLTVEPGETYSQCVERPFRLTLATLNTESAKPDIKSKLAIKVGEFSYTLCTLMLDRVEQQPLDLIIGQGEDVSFWVTGENQISLLGYYEDQTPLDYPYFGSDEEEEFEDENLDDEEEGEEEFDDDEEFDEEEDEEEDDDDVDIQQNKRNGFPIKMNTDMKKGDTNKLGNKPKQQLPAIMPMQVNSSQNKGAKRSIPIQDKSDSSKKAKLEETVTTQKDATPMGKSQQLSSSTRNPSAADQPKKGTTTASGSKTTTTAAKSQSPTSPTSEDRTPKKKVLPSGLEIEDLSVGTGPRARAGKRIGIRYIGRLENGTVFDKNTDGAAFSFNLGKNEVIKGWDMGIQGMAVGGQRKLVIPPGLVSGEKGSSMPNDFPKNAKLQFEIKLLSVE